MMEDLLQNIINDLVAEKVSLETTLLKAKVIAYKINNEALKKWIDSELNGYSVDSELPEYRKQAGQVMGNMSNGFHRLQNIAIPIAHLHSNFIELFTILKFYDSISSLEQTIRDNQSGILQGNLTPEHCAIINHKIPTTNGFIVEIAYTILPVGRVKEILSTVKSKLLEFVLELENTFEMSLDFKTMKKEEEKINQIINQTIYGNHNVVVSGTKNNTNVTFNIKENNIEELISFLKEKGVPNEDLDELKSILPTEQFDHEKKTYGPKTKKWLSKVTAKAIEGTWQVGLSAAGQILGTALGQYYGIQP